MTQLSLLDYRPLKPTEFSGRTFDTKLDKNRLCTQYQLVWNLMADHEWRTLKEISILTGASEAAASARLRDFRKVRCGAHIVERRRIGGGLFAYRVLMNKG